tara:strand:- start:180 stop:785 length:606 start_codon:yes stop_codon:yes gene_type:complete
VQKNNFVSRGALKLLHIFELFKFDIKGSKCADLGCNIGGFTQVLLQRGASEVICVDTAYGILDWKLRNDPRTHVFERTNALHAPPPIPPCNFIAIDLGWTPQSLALPAAAKWCQPNGIIVSLIKPHYEVTALNPQRRLKKDPLSRKEAYETALNATKNAPEGLQKIDLIESPITGLKSSRQGEGNYEFLLILKKEKRDLSL